MQFTLKQTMLDTRGWSSPSLKGQRGHHDHDLQYMQPSILDLWVHVVYFYFYWSESVNTVHALLCYWLNSMTNKVFISVFMSCSAGRHGFANGNIETGFSCCNNSSCSEMVFNFTQSWFSGWCEASADQTRWIKHEISSCWKSKRPHSQHGAVWYSQ